MNKWRLVIRGLSIVDPLPLARVRRLGVMLLLACCTMGWMGCQKEGTVYQEMNVQRITILSALSAYRLATGELPTQTQGLSALVKRPEDLPAEIPWKPICRQVPQDPWGNAYEYSPSLEQHPPTFEIRSFGTDGVRSEDDVSDRIRVDALWTKPEQ